MLNPYLRTITRELTRDPHPMAFVLTEQLASDELKRIVFDARQVSVFEQMAEALPSTTKGRLRVPFPDFYLEFSNPVEMSVGDGDYTEYARAILVQPVHLPSVGTYSAVTMFLDSVDQFGGMQMTYRSWGMRIEAGNIITFPETLESTEQDYAEWSIWDDIPDGAGEMLDAIHHYSSLVCWLVAYMMSKTVVIRLHLPSRAERRREERNGQVPQAWHIVDLDPKVYVDRSGERDEGDHTPHRIRYDVVGHLRFNRHRVKTEGDSWEYRHTIEWVPAHQRGTHNDLYVPKTYRVQRGKTASRVMHEWFREP